MTEFHFIDLHQERWKVFETELRTGLRTEPDRLSDLYIALMDDLSYAQTHFPGSTLTRYLNQLAISAHQQIYGSRREERSRFRIFFRDEVPAAFVDALPYFRTAGLILIASMLLGWCSGSLESDFLRNILGDEYVNRTLRNIEHGDPMGVYRDSESHAMFMMISTNNVRVAFSTFILGIFGGIPTVLLLLYNGVMVGAFLQFFMQHALLGTAASTILLHGAVELTAIVIAGACGLMLGSAVLFPGTYGRMTFLMMRARQALKILIGVVPFILAAALIESYLTRYYQSISMWVRILFILGTFALMMRYLLSGKKHNHHAAYHI